ncbi:SMI1/KNR4 family protein [Streptomyces sp. NBRC 109706]|uniref:SMI1/KNR4 family protein n=1 Tax=Streptomyces sp. NBRC 109706 TaxID=1550035 RepID=UPI000781934E|nr:SMI1/KNR4 family protein [Streptomyces sp. NBRC 109706]
MSPIPLPAAASIDRLLALVPPPSDPVAADADWAAAEAALGLVLPADLKEVWRRYGAGMFCGEVGLCSPEQLVESNRRLLGDWATMREDYPEEYPLPFHPEPGGLLVWALDSVGGALCWLTEGDPAGWPVVRWQQRDGDFARCEGGAADRLVAEVERLVARSAEGGVPYDAPWFSPRRELVHVELLLTPSPMPYPERLRLLRERLAPTVGRGGWADPDGGVRQDHFLADELGWRLTYEMAYGHRLRVNYPPADEERARETVLAAVAALGCRVISAHGAAAGWGPAPAED